MSRRKRLGAPWELMAIASVAGVVWLFLADLMHADHTAAGLVAGAVWGLLTGVRAHPWADRAARRFGYRVVRDTAAASSGRRTTTTAAKGGARS